MKKYNKVYIANHAAHCVTLAVPTAIIILVVTLIFDIFDGDVFLTFVPLAIGLVAFLWGFVNNAAFEASIKKQSVPFDDKNSRSLFNGANVYLSDNWLIVAGKFAAPREAIKRISVGSSGETVKNFSLGVILENGKSYQVTVDSQASAKKVITWLNKNEENARKKK